MFKQKTSPGPKIMPLAGVLAGGSFFRRPAATSVVAPFSVSSRGRAGTNMKSKSKWMRWLRSAIPAFILALPVGYFAPSWALAGDQEMWSVARQHDTHHRYSKPSLDERVSRFAKNLDLNDAQKAAVKNILEQRQQEILRIRLDPSITGTAGIDRFRALQESTVERIRAVLNEEQKKKYNPLAVRSIPQTPQPSVEDWLKVMTPN
jgi:hypothetical protein